MPYINADEIFPPRLVEEIRKYARGCLIYIPQAPAQRLGWGARNGARESLDRRNEAIRAAKAHGLRIDELAELYHLSEDGIKKILYRKRLPATMAGA